MSFIVAIDGPAGSGKGTITEEISTKFDLVNIGTGTAYRAIALQMIYDKVSINEKDRILKLLDKIDIEFKQDGSKSLVYLNGKDVTQRVRNYDVASLVGPVSAIKEVRFKLNDIFRKYAKGKKVIMEGRDIGTYVFPNADVKIYLDATKEERATRRLKQNQEKGIDLDISYEEILQNIEKRDEIDKNKEIGALKQADDAIYIDSTNMDIQDVVEEISKIIQEKIK